MVVLAKEENMVEVKNLSFAYPEGPPVLDGLSFTVKKGETVVFLGPNGAGKSTLCLTLNSVLKASGQIRIANYLLGRKTAKKIRQQVGLVFQNPNDQLFLPTVKDELFFGPLNLGWSEKDIDLRMKYILKKLNLEGFEERVITKLSLGEKKKVALASVLILEPDVLILDEPTAGLDYGSKKNLIAYIKALPLTKLIATHDLELAWEVAEKVFILDKGRIISSGSREEILLDEKLLQAHHLDIPLLAKIERLPHLSSP